VSQVAIAAFAPNLGAHHSVADILNVADMIRIEGFEKARPSGAGFELGAGSKQGQATKAATVHAILLVVEQAAAKGRLGPMVEQNPAFFGAQPLGERITLGVAKRVECVSRF
jgi:hypothetical protein